MPPLLRRARYRVDRLIAEHGADVRCRTYRKRLRSAARSSGIDRRPAGSITPSDAGAELTWRIIVIVGKKAEPLGIVTAPDAKAAIERSLRGVRG
jgi:hypothetical protein